MEQFEQNYRALNAAQKQAVDTIEGPVMVVAGPGTGKTQLLSMRVANILRKTDANPGNILCLTFTESGASAMRERLVSLIGQQAYGVAIHTFHSFGSEIINNYGDYFYRGAHFRPANELSSYEILQEIFEKLQHDNPLASKMNGEYTHLSDTQRAISDLKKSGLTPDELVQILDHNDAFISYAMPIVQPLFADRLSKKSYLAFEAAIDQLEAYKPSDMPVIGYAPLSQVATNSLQTALNQAETDQNTKALGAWRSNWLEKDESGDYVFKDVKKSKKLRALSSIYYEYLVAMQERELFDFDDMILRVVHGLEVFSELRYNLQEQYQYILVDEFQDTNGAQMRLLFNLTNNPVNNGRPNILVVGDDDQAIYRFQGADISNILSFRDVYKDTAIITLTDNYRSTEPILLAARAIITQGVERLENRLENINKQLVAHNNHQKTQVQMHLLSSQTDEYSWLADSVKKQIEAGQDASQIAIIGRNHSELQKVLPYLNQAGLPVSYERQDNILQSLPVITVEQMAKVVTLLSDQQFDDADSLMPELLSHPAWGISAIEIWRLSLKAYKDRRMWLEEMLKTPGRLKDIAEWLIVTSHLAEHEPLEVMLDRLLGTNEFQVAQDSLSEADEPFTDGPTEEFVSPYRAYYFPNTGLNSNASQYLSYLSALTTLRGRLREYRPDTTLYLKDFVDFLALHRKTGITISASQEFQCHDSCVQLMTAHKSKGLEFDNVYVMSLSDQVWGSKSRGRSSSISFPVNLPLSPAGDNDDERIRLLFVAMTRARKNLFLSAHQQNSAGKDVLLTSYLQVPELPPQLHDQTSSDKQLVTVAETTWHEQLLNLPKADVSHLLTPMLRDYKLSATHLNNFIDVTAGGPQSFLLQNLLRFPQAMSPSAAFGSAVHGALQRAHAHLSATGKRRPVEDVLHDFESLLNSYQLMRRDIEHLQKKGSDVLSVYLQQRYDSFNDRQLVERSFANQGVCIDDVRLTGAIDLLDIDKTNQTIVVTDYKTGKPAHRWQGTGDFEKIKLHKYKQQLMLYKLLVENSRDFGGKFTVQKGVLEFVEPTPNRHDVVCLELHYESEELERFKKLLSVVWSHIQALDFPDVSNYEQNYKGILQFESDLLSE